MRVFRRRRHDDEEDEIIEGEVEDIDEETETTRRSQLYQSVTAEDAAITPYQAEQTQEEAAKRSRWRIRLPRIILWREIQPGLLMLALGLTGGGVFWTMSNLERIPTDAEQWWPAVLLSFTLLWSLVALVRRHIAAFLAGTMLAGISISLLLDSQDLIRWEETLVGVVLMAVGVGIIARGLLLRQGRVA